LLQIDEAVPDTNLGADPKCHQVAGQIPGLFLRGTQLTIAKVDVAKANGKNAPSQWLMWTLEQ
jgi:hypothetical protein